MLWDAKQFFIRLPQIECGLEEMVNEDVRKQSVNDELTAEAFCESHCTFRNSETNNILTIWPLNMIVSWPYGIERSL